jgi:predicted porin
MMKMKRSLLVTALGLCSTAAFASNVTLYGTVDGAVSVSKAKGESAKVQMLDGVAGGSVWGLQGEEDLGGDTKVVFQLENGFTVNDGQAAESGLSWAKEARVGIEGAFGEISLGRIGALSSYEGSYSVWDASPFGTDYLQAGLGNVAVGSGTILNNSVIYVTPEFGGVKISAQYSNGVETDTAKWKKNSHYYGLGAAGEWGGLGLAGIVEYFDNKATDGDDKQKGTTLLSISASYDFEVAKVYAGYQYANRFHAIDGFDEDFALTGKGANQNAFMLGAEFGLAGGTAKIGGGYSFGKVKDENFEGVDGQKKFDRWNVGAAYEYPLSKRTFVYGWGAVTQGGKLFKKEAEGAFDKASFNSWSAGVGIHHSF